ncbi:MAG TPA: hypothetical protein VIV07_01205 [Sphingomicrobium sp.]
MQAQRFDRQQFRANRVQQQAQTRMAERQQLRANRMQAQNRMADRQQFRANRIQQVQNRTADRQQLRNNRIQQVQNQGFARQQMQANRQVALQNRIDNRNQLQGARQMAVQQRIATLQNMRENRFTTLNVAPRTRVLAPVAATALVGVPVATAAAVTTLAPLPATVSYLYPATPNYYYQYGDGYVYQIDRSTSLIDALFPLLAGGYMPGSYLPAGYMNSYVPNYYGFNSFYPDYGNTCYRYGYGVVYEVDCFTGLVEDVIPTYAGGYGVGQMLPSAYDYYNVPLQYRSMYYNTADAGYWYAPGAIYQYDPGSSMITGVAALMSPGFTVGQPLPMGYDVYNVPYAYRATYYDTPNAWYRYNNGYIYQVDPTTMLVSAIVASVLT